MMTLDQLHDLKNRLDDGQELTDQDKLLLKETAEELCEISKPIIELIKKRIVELAEALRPVVEQLQKANELAKQRLSNEIYVETFQDAQPLSAEIAHHLAMHQKQETNILNRVPEYLKQLKDISND